MQLFTATFVKNKYKISHNFIATKTCPLLKITSCNKLKICDSNFNCDVQSAALFLFFARIYPPFTRKQIVSLSFGRYVRTRSGVAISEMSGPPVFHIKVGASR